MPRSRRRKWTFLGAGLLVAILLGTSVGAPSAPSLPSAPSGGPTGRIQSDVSRTATPAPLPGAMNGAERGVAGIVAGPVGPSAAARSLPGAEVLDGLRARAGSAGGARPADGGGGVPAGNCYGIWPSDGGQSQYLPACYGHDEPGIAGYSELAGSGGNVTWSVVLPVGTALGAMQSDLYSAIWFGMPLQDPFGFLGECFLELQFYPDSSDPIDNTFQLNSWSAAAVAWQIEAVNGVEDACFYATMTVTGSAGDYLVMHGGDHVVVKMIGWENDSQGEYLQVLDQTTRALSTVHLYNSTGRFPLDPAYATASWANSLQWTPGGELPATFAFETGHTTYPYPDTNGYGGCSSGPPPSTTRDPAVPCPSYDPGSWLNDTVSPWEISPPTFFNANASETAGQVAFTQDFGGLSFIDPLSNGTCDGRDGSAWCSYPWYSYSCRTHAFEFGATDWSSTSADFGRFGEYAQTPVLDRGQFEYYPPTNASVPACGAPGFGLHVDPAGGVVQLLNASFGSAGSVPGLLPGEYSISATALVGSGAFVGWRTSGGASVPSWEIDAPTATVELSGNGSIAATWSTVPVLVTVQFNESDANATVEVVPGIEGGATVTPPLTLTVADGASVDLAPGDYSIHSQPPPGENFSAWKVVQGAASVAANLLPFTWLRVGGSGAAPGKVVVEVTTVRTSAQSTVVLYPYATAVSHGPTGNASGTIEFDGVDYPGVVYLPFPVGTYSVSEHPAPGSVFAGWYFGGELRALNFANTTTVTLENGTAYIEAAFSVAVNVTLDLAGNLGAVDLGGAGWQGEGSVVSYPAVPVNETLAAEPPNGESFLDWTAVPATNLSVRDPSSAFTSVQINGTGTLTAHFVAAPTLGFLVSIGPVGSGAVTLDGAPFANGSIVTNLAGGLYLAGFSPGSLERFQGWNLSGGMSAVDPISVGWPAGTEIVNLTGAGATLAAVTAATTAPVTFLLGTGSGSGSSFRVGTTTIPSGGTLALGPGAHTVRLSSPLGSGVAVRAWNGTAGIRVVQSNATGATFFVNGSGSLVAEVDSVLQVTASAYPQLEGAPGAQWAPETVDFVLNVTGGSGAYSVLWSLPNMSASIRYHIFPQPGVYPWSVYVQDVTNPANATTVSGVVVVGGPPLEVRPNATPTIGEPPTAVTFSATASGGARPYQFGWWVPILGVNGSGASFQANFTQPGTYTAWSNVTDGTGFLASAPVRVTIEPLLSVIASASAQRGRAPFNISFSAAANNGVETGGSYLYNWSFGDGGFANGSTVRHEFLAGGNFTTTVEVSDLLGYTASQSFLIELLPPYPALNATIAATPDHLELGSSTNISVSAHGGTGQYTYHFPRHGVPTGCVPRSINDSYYSCDPSAAGTFRIEVIVNDTGGRSVNASSALVVDAPSVPPKHGSNGTSNGSGAISGAYLLGIAALVAIALLVGLVLSRRRRLAATPPEGEPGLLDEDSLPPLEVIEDPTEPADGVGSAGPGDPEGPTPPETTP